LHVEHGVKASDLKNIVHAAGQMNQLEFSLRVAHGSISRNHFSDSGAVDIVDVAQVEKNLAAAVLDQLADHLAQDRAAFTQSDLAAKVHYGHVANFPACTL